MIGKMTERGTVIIPKEVRQRTRAAELFEVVLRDDGIIELRPQVTVDASQAWFWTERWQRVEREVDDAYAAGQYRTYADAEAFLADLDRETEEYDRTGNLPER